ncbi:MAG TPA: sigma-70 family RNA polymerase sigma factor [Acidobacteriaceae bacterium]|nr:sigma-70 family RNA polymerase sigma factor [Acidobacteriaceae bacterium]
MRPEEEAEFAGVVERQWRFAYRVAWAVLRNAHDAEDAAQETFLKMLRGGAWRGLRDERAFVARAAWRAAVDRLRQNRTRATEPDDGAVEEMPDIGMGPEAAVVTADWEASVHRLIDGLPEELRQPLALSAEMNSREIAAAMGIAEGTVRTRLMRARQILRQKMGAMEERHYARR